ncbi:ABC transporter ATP-binding protein [Raineyella sp.]|uniref:Bicarbonate transport ATP-binding protein CmpD n=1 Tax=bioreactor metagenome TaxID=1076179 RepID=A0A644ZPE4_9ZZZZ|nr:ATP-binding cassette domain-containing protein [Raineyella sp.]MEA5154128.1 ATP-binding cassette domain-containing protein [Raineyella sp.]
MTTHEAKLELTNVTKVFYPHTVNERVALKAVSLTLSEGDFVTIIGSNGAGKSTLLNVIAGAHRPEAGSIRIDGREVSRLADFQRARYISRVFQDPMAGTSPHMTIEQNLAMALSRGRRRGLGAGVSARKRERFRAELATLELGLEDRLGVRVGMLSGGQRQALSLLMATFSEPEILLLDEHTAALDPQRAALVTRLTGEAVRRHGLTALMVTHNMEQALQLGNRLIMMHEGDVIFEIDAGAKAKATVPDLLNEFGKVRGATEALSDRTLLG